MRGLRLRAAGGIMPPMRRKSLLGCSLASLALLVVGGCALGRPAHAAKAARPQADWRDVATSGDKDRLRRWRDAWTQALAQIAASGDSGQLAAHPVLTTPDAALDDPTPPPGDYSCRTYKLGTQIKGGLNYVSYPPYTCRIRRTRGGELHFDKLNGSQRPSGLLYPDDGRRLIFLGTMTLGDETRPSLYGLDAERDMIGIFERTGPKAWRLVLPFPRWESTLDVIELNAP